MSGGSARVFLPLGWMLRRARETLDDLRRPRPGEPVPPRRLRARVGVPEAHEYILRGRQAAQELSQALGAVGRDLADFGSVLDFGCGSARVLPHVASMTRARCAGCDVDAEAIGWARDHHPSLRWTVSPAQPPLPYPSQSFDLVYSISVFSHLNEPSQDRWLQELFRLLRPGGVALLTVHGRYAFEQFRTGSVTTRWSSRRPFDRGPLGAGEFVFVPYVRSMWNRRDLPGVEAEYGLAFHDADYVREHWSKRFEVLDVVDRGMTGWQDVVVCARQSAAAHAA